MSRYATAFAAAIVLTASGSASIFAQTTAPGDVVGVGGFSHIVADVERSVAFYRDMLGLEQ
jgi:hypothetical protein